MNKLHLPNFNLEWTLLGGQTHSWDKINDNYIGFTQKQIIVIQEIDKENILWQTYPHKDDENFIKEYLNLNKNYSEILTKINKDHHIKQAIKHYPNLRILKQDFEENLLIFILSSHKNMKAIRKSVRYFAQNYGTKVKTDFGDYNLFPSTERLSELSEKELRATGIGFRARYMKDATNKLLNGTIDKRKFNNEESARNELIKIVGVGEKIADCVLTFSLGYDNVTPLDVWSKRVLTDLYNIDPKMKYQDMRKFISEYFEGYAAWAGQFLFEYYRNLKK